MSDIQNFYDDLASDYLLIFEDWWASVKYQSSVLPRHLGQAKKVLDISCGPGTQCFALNLAGYSVEGRDLSPWLVSLASSEATRRGVALRFSVANMCHSQPGDAGQFDAVISIDNALPHLSDPDLSLALGNAFAALAPGGVFLASIRDYDALRQTRPRFDEPRLFGTTPNRRVIQQLWDWSESGDSYRLTHFVLREAGGDWSMRSRRVKYRALLRAELTALAEQAGFTATEWRMPEESGFYQPLFLARRACR